MARRHDADAGSTGGASVVVRGGESPSHGEGGFVNFKARIFSYIDGVVVWKLAHWLARKYRSGIKPLMRHWLKSPDGTQAKTWVLFGRTNNGHLHGAVLARLVGHSSQGFRWTTPVGNPYLASESRATFTSRYRDVAMAVSPV